MSKRQKSEQTEMKVSRREFLKAGVVEKGTNIIDSLQETPGKKILLKRRTVSRRTFLKVAAAGAAVAGAAMAVPIKLKLDSKDAALNYKGKVTPADRIAAASRVQALRAKSSDMLAHAAVLPVPGGTPDYFGPYANWANSPMPKGAVSAIMLTAGGSGYVAPTVSINDAYGTGTGATATATVVGGVITSIALGGGGSNYTAPQVLITDSTGVDASAFAVMSGVLTGGIHKFVDSLPGLNTPNNLGQQIPIAVPDKLTYAGCDYYEISLVQYSEKMHTDLPATRLRGYVQTNNGTNVAGTANTVAPAPVHFLGPLIVAQRDRPVRIKFTNALPTGSGGNLFIPVDTTYMGAGAGPSGGNYKQNRAVLHLHGGTTPWISDGTPHQWTTPAGESTAYPKGVSVQNVPDMPAPGAGKLTFFYSNQQSARLMFYHDHAYGITRLNVYAGEAAGYLLQDPVEATLVSGGTIPGTTTTVPIGTIPADQIPLVIQDKTWVDPTTIPSQDPTWNWGNTHPTPHAGDLWFPHVYMPNQNPFDASGANAMGRWDYGPWFWPPYTGLQIGPAPNPYVSNGPPEPPIIPGTPNPSGVPEAFMDTPIVNGTAYPYVVVQPKAYRLRILNACNDRFVNLQLHQATGIVSSLAITNGGSGYTRPPRVTISGGGGANATATATIINGNVTALTLKTVGSGYTSAPAVTIAPPTVGTTATATAAVYTGLTEVGMVPAVPGGDFPDGWPTPDARDGGWPDPDMTGPEMIQIGTEGGFLPSPVTIPNRPVGYNYNRRDIVVLNVQEKALFLGPAERADVIVDFSAFAGQTLILYNDSPAPVPAFDPRIDYYTNTPDQTSTGGSPPTQPGYGPNTRTIMQIRVAAVAQTVFDPAPLNTALPAAFSASQDTIIVPQAPYNAAYHATFPGGASAYVKIQDTSYPLIPIAATPSAVTGITVTNIGSSYGPPAPPNIGAIVGATWVAGKYGNSLNFNGLNNRVEIANSASLALTTAISVSAWIKPTALTGTHCIYTKGAPAGNNYGIEILTIGNKIVFYLSPSAAWTSLTSSLTLNASAWNHVAATWDGSTMRLYINGALDPNTASFAGPIETSAFDVHWIGETPWGTAPFNGQIDEVRVHNRALSLAEVQATMNNQSPRNGLVGEWLFNEGTGTTANDSSWTPNVIIAAPTTAGGITASAIATVNAGTITLIQLINGGSGYTYPPIVTILDRSGTGALAITTIGSTAILSMPLQPKAIQELFTVDYGRMNATLGVELPNTNITNQTTLPMAYIDPPTEIVRYSDMATPIGAASDGTQLWKITHNGVDTHAIHVHMFNAQIVNRVGWDGAIRPPEPNELGWKETIRMNPLEDIIIAVRPITIVNLPFKLPNSVRLLDPTAAAGTTTQFTGIDPNGNPITVTNALTNFGCEYVWHCHLLGHEENDMMRAMIMGLPPEAPTGLTPTRISSTIVRLDWTDNSLNTTGWIVQRATDAAFVTNPATFTIAANITTYLDGTAVAGTLYYYRVIATNIVGSTALGYPTMTLLSGPSNVVSITP